MGKWGTLQTMSFFDAITSLETAPPYTNLNSLASQKELGGEYDLVGGVQV